MSSSSLCCVVPLKLLPFLATDWLLTERFSLYSFVLQFLFWSLGGNNHHLFCTANTFSSSLKENNSQIRYWHWLRGFFRATSCRPNLRTHTRTLPDVLFTSLRFASRRRESNFHLANYSQICTRFARPDIQLEQHWTTTHEGKNAIFHHFPARGKLLKILLPLLLVLLLLRLPHCNLPRDDDFPPLFLHHKLPAPAAPPLLNVIRRFSDGTKQRIGKILA